MKIARLLVKIQIYSINERKSKAFKVLSKMKFFSLFLLDLILISIVPLVSLSPIHSEICAETDNHQMIREVVHWKNVLFILFENRNAYKLVDFKWNGTGFNFENSVKLDETLNSTLIFPVLYPGNGRTNIG